VAYRTCAVVHRLPAIHPFVAAVFAFDQYWGEFRSRHVSKWVSKLFKSYPPSPAMGRFSYVTCPPIPTNWLHKKYEVRIKIYLMFEASVDVMLAINLL